MAIELKETSREKTRRRLISTCIILLLLALGVRLLVWQFNQAAIAPVMSSLTEGYKNDARVLARGDVGLFLRGPDPPSNANVIAHPPGYSILMAAIFSVFSESDFALRLFQIICDSISVVLVFLIAFKLLSKGVGLIAGALAALSPQLAYNSLLLLPDSLSVLPSLVAVLLLIHARGESRRWQKIAAAGAMMGLSCWLRPNGLLLPLFVAAIIPIVFERGNRLRMLVPLVAGAVIIIAPLTIRNAVVFKRFVPISLGSGVTLIEGIADYDGAGTSGLKRTDMEVLQDEARVFNRPDYAGSLFNPDGVQRERDRVALGVTTIRSRPIWFLGVMIRRAASMLRLERVPVISGSPLVLESHQATTSQPSFGLKLLQLPAMILKTLQKLFITAVMLPLGLIGLLVLAKRRQKFQMAVLLVVPFYFLCIQSLLHTEYRYLLAIQYFLLVLVGVAIDSIRFERGAHGVAPLQMSL